MECKCLGQVFDIWLEIEMYHFVQLKRLEIYHMCLFCLQEYGRPEPSAKHTAAAAGAEVGTAASGRTTSSSGWPEALGGSGSLPHHRPVIGG